MLVGIEEKNPGSGGGMIPQKPVSLLGKLSIPFKIDHLGTMVDGDFPCPVGASGVYHHNPSGKILADSIKTEGDVLFFIQNRNDNGKIEWY